jgi:hypothetical protein
MQRQSIKNVIEANEYRVVPLAARHTDDAVMLKEILRNPAQASADPKRDGFYWVEGEGYRFYVNVRDTNRTVYLVAVEGGIPRQEMVEAEAAC